MADAKALKNKTIITVATTGAWPKKKDNPNVPMTPEEIAEDVYECWKAGAAVAHIHMRDDDGNGIMDPVRFKKTYELIRAHKDCDIIVNMTTSGDIHADDDIRVAHVKELKPEMASYDCGSMNWLNSGLFLNTPKFLEDCGLLFQELNVKPEIEAFDPGMIGNAAYYIKKGVLKTPVHFQFCMGCANGISGTMKNLVFMKEEAERLVGAGNFTWSCFGVGHSAMEMLYGAVALGGHIRVGMEDNVLYSKGKLADSNKQFVERAVRVIKEYGREVATPDEARQLLNLPPYQA
ncbi:MAG: 3-keto-5-aminohexanoate cleavage protein [Parasporobacterium sp.]|nr:3-keto-5-aminohexanoate cleavage protein [Parasporobacterium sp.]